MAYRFKLTEPFATGVRRIALQQIDRATRQLRDGEDLSAAIHQTRKGLKRIRALLRLARPALGEPVFREENARYRAIGLLLADARDRTVMAQTAEALERTAEGKSKVMFAALKVRIAGRQAVIVDPCDSAIPKALAALEVAELRMNALALPDEGFAPAWKGLERSCRKGARAFARACQDPRDVIVHDWRKCVQHHWRHMSLLQAAWPEMFDAQIATARRLSGLLGEDHDIGVLRAALQAGDLPPLAPSHALAFDRLAAARQAVLRETAYGLGRLLHADAPDAFAARIASYWNVAIAGPPVPVPQQN
jgi:CHAD domain-containing protein